MLDPAQGDLADAPVQRESSELRLGRVRRKDFNLPAAQVLDQPAQVQPDLLIPVRRPFPFVMLRPLKEVWS